MPGNGEFDVDLVVEIINKYEDQLEAIFIKNLIGNALKKSARYSPMLMNEKRRAWTLDYENKSHVDVVPSIVTSTDSDILITDKVLENYRYIGSSPQKFNDWFVDKSRGITSKEFFEKNLRNSIQKLPEYGNGTILQRAVRLIKYHRNKYFEDNSDEKIKPISMIITILIAESYAGEKDLFSAITNIVPKMRSKIISNMGKDFVFNPVDSNENFADKWSMYPERREAFFKWLSQLEEDFLVDKFKSRLTINKIIERSFGDRINKDIFDEFGKMHNTNRTECNIRIDDKYGINIYGIGNEISKHNFYGGESY